MPRTTRYLLMLSVLREAKTSRNPSTWSAQLLIGNCHTHTQIDTGALIVTVSMFIIGI